MTKRLLLFGLIAGLIAGCHPGGAEFVDELDLVLTSYEESFDFGGANTFALPDKIPVVTGNLADGEDPEFLEEAKASVILDKIRTNFVTRGYTEVQDDADLVVPVAVMSTTTLVLYCDYWWDYWSWWGYYPGYPGYGGCYYPSGYSYTTGTIVITAIDGANEDGKPETPVNAVWGAAINGLLEGSDASLSARVEKSIDQAFAQSTYLQSN